MKLIGTIVGAVCLVAAVLLAPTVALAAAIAVVGTSLLVATHMGVFYPGGPFDKMCEDMGIDSPMGKLLMRLLVVALACAVTGGAGMASGAGGLATGMAAASMGAQAFSSTNVAMAIADVAYGENGDEEKKQQLALIINIVVMVILLLGTVGAGFAGAGGSAAGTAGKNASGSAAKSGAQAGSSGATTGTNTAAQSAKTAATSTKTAAGAADDTMTITQRMRQMIQNILDKLDDVNTPAQLQKFQQGMAVGAGVVEGSLSLYMAKLQKDMGDLEKDIGDSKAAEELIENLKKFLQALLGDIDNALASYDESKADMFQLLEELVASDAKGAVMRNTSA